MIRVRIIETGEIKEYEESYALRLIEQGVAVYDDGDTPVDPEPVPVDPFKYMEIFGITVEDDTGLAREAHEIGDLFEYDDKLYVATAPIAQGAAIVPDTNCERTTFKEIANSPTKADKTDTVLLTTLSRGRKAGTTVGDASFAFGQHVEASGDYSHAEGTFTTASAICSHAEGSSTTASGNYSHAEGTHTTASGFYSHAEGSELTASGHYSHAEGFRTSAEGTYTHAEGRDTIANHRSQHAAGEYNIADPSTAASNQRGTYVEIIGNGTDDNNRSNARTLDWEGNEVLAGGLTLGGGLTIGSTAITEAQLQGLLALLNT